MGVVFDLLRAIAEYWFRIRKRKSEGVKIEDDGDYATIIFQGLWTTRI